MSITELFKGTAHKDTKRAGRGISAGRGKTAGRGTKGQKARTGSGRKIKEWFEGGQTPLFRKLAKRRGIANTRPKPLTITTDVLNRFYRDGEVVSPQTLLEKNIVRASQLKPGIKIVRRAELTAKLTFTGVNSSKSLQ